MVLIAHENVAGEMMAAVEHVVGEQTLAEVLNVFADDDPDELKARLEVLIRKCDVGNGVLLFADMFGGTPCNIALGSMQPGKVEVISGFNLPLLIKAAVLRREADDLKDVARQVLESGRQYMCMASDYMDDSNDRGCNPAEGDQANA